MPGWQEQAGHECRRTSHVWHVIDISDLAGKPHGLEHVCILTWAAQGCHLGHVVALCIGRLHYSATKVAASCTS
jgi:hypothetical protein